jgi:hypothetical protein
MKEIQLTRGFVALVDDEDFDRINKWKWHCVIDNNNRYAVRSQRINGQSKAFLMHREILNPPDGYFVDHKNRDGLNNQKDNLRLSTKSQNCKNRRGHGKSKYLGVSEHQSGKWQARIQPGVKKPRLFLGTFDDEKDAALAYNKAAVEFHGEFANLNNV